ncbi:MAG: DUF3883 domain-containing protein [Acidobacteria bacterium]|nr:DUF3883 domain-containing protein [Acidobacteriota bacterium]
MSFRKLRRRVINRLDEGDRGDRAWFLITRVHLNAGRLRDIATYLYDLGVDAGRDLEAHDYEALAKLAGVTGPDPGMTLRRHHFLAMETPLNLVRRVDGRSWRKIRLTHMGAKLATTENSAALLEAVLDQVVFCREPWYTPTRVNEYRHFEVRPYTLIRQVMADSDGWVDRDEYDLFISRIRRETEAAWAIKGIREFRGLNGYERSELLEEVRRRIPGAKAYQNWRDMGLHTFSLFSIGTSTVRVDQRLLLTATLVERGRVPKPERAQQRRVAGARATALRIPEPPRNPGLATPPVAPTVNPGTEGELLVAKLLQAAGWSVVFYTNRRGFGFDIWARRGKSTMLVEVKSSFHGLGPITLTRLEHEAAKEYGQNYILAIVENVSEVPTVRFIQDPVRTLKIQKRTTREYHIARDAWAIAGQLFRLRSAQ